MLKDISICGWDSMIEAYCQYTVTMTTMNTTMTELSGGFSPTRHKTGHFGDVSPSQSLGLVWKKLNLTQRQKHTFTNQKKSSTTQNKHKNYSQVESPFMTSSMLACTQVKNWKTLLQQVALLNIWRIRIEKMLLACSQTSSLYHGQSSNSS